jgi:hypothetical protein
MLREASPILALVGWEIFLSPSSVVLAPPLAGLLSVFHRKGIAYKVILVFLLMKRYSAVAKKLTHNASNFVLHATALAANREQIPIPALIAAAQGR